MSNLNHYLMLLMCSAAAALLPACSSDQPARPAAKISASESPEQVQNVPEIQWFDGNVDEALARARDLQRPLFLFWGAVWCPPCNLIKSTVFTDPEFVEQTRDFIAVYLDGDREDAQRWGEHFSAMGYPTLIVLSPEGEEITRLSSGQQPETYRQVLKRVQNKQLSVARMFAMALAQPASLEASDWAMLSQYGWELDQGQLLQDRSAIDVFDQFAQSASDPATQARFALLAELARLAMNQTPSRAAAPLLKSLLSLPALLRANLPELQYQGGALLLALPVDEQGVREELVTVYQEAMAAIWDDQSLPLKLRFNAHHGLLELALAELIDKSSFANTLSQRVAWLQDQQLTPQQAQSMIPGAAWMLHKLGQSAQARTMLEAYIEHAITPYYSMSYLAAIEEDLGNNAAALQWSARAWQLADGPATKIQWGLGYLNRLLLLAPQRGAEIVAVLSAVFTQLEQHPGSFYQRTRLRLQRSLTHLQAWAEWPEHRQQLASLQVQLDALCSGLQVDHPSASVCAQYLALSRSAET